MTKRPVLYSNRLRLRPLEEGDYDLMAALGCNSEVMRFIQHPLTPDDTREIMPILIDYPHNPQLGHWVVETRHDDMAIGEVSLGYLPLNRADVVPGLKPGDVDYSEDIEVGYLFLPEAWGKGYATEAATRLLAHAFDDLKLEKVVAVTAPDNSASQNVLRKIGMKDIGNLYAYGSNGPGFEIDLVEWSRIRIPD